MQVPKPRDHESFDLADGPFALSFKSSSSLYLLITSIPNSCLGKLLVLTFWVRFGLSEPSSLNLEFPGPRKHYQRNGSQKIEKLNELIECRKSPEIFHLLPSMRQLIPKP